MEYTYKIVNCMRTTYLPNPIDLETLHYHLPQSKLLRGRPRMLVIRLTNGRNIQIFQNGKIQVLGAISNFVAQQMKCELQLKLNQIQNKKSSTKVQAIKIPNWMISNLVVSININQRLKLSSIPYSDHFMSYEPEIFPALLINYLKPVHVAVFHNGKIIVTGLKLVNQIPALVKCIYEILSPYIIKK